MQDRAESHMLGAGSRVSAGLAVGAPARQKPVPLVGSWALEQTCQLQRGKEFSHHHRGGSTTQQPTPWIRYLTPHSRLQFTHLQNGDYKIATSKGD